MTRRIAAAATLSLALILALLVGTAPLGAAEPPKPADQSKTASQPASTPQAPSAADMEMMMKLAAPGEHHKDLDRLAGKWATSGKSWMAPGQPPVEMNGSMEASWTLGGRFLQSVHKGNFMGQPFEGHGLDGYDNVTHKYVGSWVDNMGTGLMAFEGSCDNPCKVLTTTGDFVDPMSRQKLTMRNVITFVDANTYHQDMYVAGPDGKEFKMMEFVGKRQ
ncbi:MAG TPA: DUF1579 domain-containing protein [Thermoanaerobaculia bacterium]|nr:DUF1579 domain-containing protein [Thermoanaerobaculia bacterium]